MTTIRLFSLIKIFLSKLRGKRWKGKTLIIVSGKGIGERRIITKYNRTTLTTEEIWHA